MPYLPMLLAIDIVCGPRYPISSWPFDQGTAALLKAMPN